jgi:hypothetical protein
MPTRATREECCELLAACCALNASNNDDADSCSLSGRMSALWPCQNFRVVARLRRGRCLQWLTGFVVTPGWATAHRWTPTTAKTIVTATIE